MELTGCTVAAIIAAIFTFLVGLFLSANSVDNAVVPTPFIATAEAEILLPTPIIATAEAEVIISSAPDSNVLYAAAEDSTDGELLYNTHCAKCHGLEGNGDGPVAGNVLAQDKLNLTNLQDRSDEELLEVITLGRDLEMPAWGLILNKEQLVSVLGYVRALGE